MPVVGVTTGPTGRPGIDPERLAATLTGHADIVLLETGEATWALSIADRYVLVALLPDACAIVPSERSTTPTSRTPPKS